MSRARRWAAPVVILLAACTCAAVWSGCHGDRAPSAHSAVAPAATEAASQPALAPLTVTVKDLRNRKGQLIFGVFRSADGFPNIESKSVYWETKDADASAVTFTAHLPPGRYAASVLHDENRSGEMNRNFANVPTEGYGVTNNPKPAFRAATFNEAAFNLPPEGREMTISVQYF